MSGFSLRALDAALRPAAVPPITISFSAMLNLRFLILYSIFVNDTHFTHQFFKIL